MKKFETDDYGIPRSIPDRLIYLRNEKKMSLSDVAKLFNVNKSTVLRWETNDYWRKYNSPNKRLLLMQLVELYQAEYEWVLHGRENTVQDKTNILVIDDDTTSLSIITLIVKSFMSSQFHIYDFTEPDHAFSWAEDNHAALVFCDYRMPHMKGDMFISKLRSLENYSSTPIIAITQVRESGLTEKLMDAGATHILQKPVDKEKLRDLLRPYRNWD